MNALDTGRAVLKLQGSFDEAITINNRDVTILADPGTILTRSSTGNILVIDGTSNVRIYESGDQWRLGHGAGVASATTGSVTLSRVVMSQNKGGGGAVSADSGTINIYQSKIFNNAIIGIVVFRAQFDIENNFIVANGNASSGDGGVQLNQTDTGTRIFSFNTIAANLASLSAVGGVSCSSFTQDLTLSNNIIFGNIANGAPQVGGAHCLWTYSDIGPGPAAIPAWAI